MHKNHPPPKHQHFGGGVIRNCHSSVLQVAWSALNHLAPQCVAMNDCRWLYAFDLGLFPLDGFGSSVPSLQLHPVFGAASSRVPPGDTMSRFVGFGDKSWDNSKNFFQTQGFEFLFLSQRARRDAFASGGADNSLDQPKRLVPCLSCTAWGSSSRATASCGARCRSGCTRQAAP